MVSGDAVLGSEPRFRCRYGLYGAVVHHAYPHRDNVAVKPNSDSGDCIAAIGL